MIKIKYAIHKLRIHTLNLLYMKILWKNFFTKPTFEIHFPGKLTCL